MQTWHLVYTSRVSTEITLCELDEISLTAAENNRAMGITGVLLYGNGNFMELIEGDRYMVEHVFERICADPRHTDIQRLLFACGRRRVFDSWSMGILGTEQHRFFSPPILGALEDMASHIVPIDASATARAMLLTLRNLLSATDA